MKKLILGSVAIGAVIALRPVVKRRVVRKMREHCQQMAAKCKQMMAAQGGGRGEVAGMPEHCKEMMERSEARGDTRKPAEPVAV